MKFKTFPVDFGFFFISFFFSFTLTASAKDFDAKRSPFLNPFLEAEHLYHSGDFDKAQLFYKNYLNGKPSDSRGNTALYRLGTIHQKNNSFIIALRYYKMILHRSPALELAHDAKFGQAQCLFELERYDEAKTLFQEIALSHPDVKKKWQSKVYLGRLDQKRFDYKSAIEKLREIYFHSEVESVRGQA
ncbi:uncharacterized protein METZ01_LOCUS204813, partial [marine metagenome]